LYVELSQILNVRTHHKKHGEIFVSRDGFMVVIKRTNTARPPESSRRLVLRSSSSSSLLLLLLFFCYHTYAG